jgi:hypothetical protein
MVCSDPNRGHENGLERGQEAGCSEVAEDRGEDAEKTNQYQQIVIKCDFFSYKKLSKNHKHFAINIYI